MIDQNTGPTGGPTPPEMHWGVNRAMVISSFGLYFNSDANPALIVAAK